MLSKKKSEQKIINCAGFTLVETIIYTMLISLILTSFTAFALIIIDIKNKNYATAQVNAAIEAVTSLINRRIKTADSIISPLIGSSSDILIIDGEGGEFSLYSDGGLLYEQIGSQTPAAIIGDKIRLENLNFTNLTIGDLPANIKIDFDLAYDGSQGFNYNDNISMVVNARQ